MNFALKKNVHYHFRFALIYHLSKASVHKAALPNPMKVAKKVKVANSLKTKEAKDNGTGNEMNVIVDTCKMNGIEECEGLSVMKIVIRNQ